jgi:LemA protein
VLTAMTATTAQPVEPDPGWVLVGIVFGVAALATLLALVVAVTMWRRRWLVADLPTSDAAHVFVGMNEVIGVGRPVRDTLIAPYSAAECVWYRARLEREEQRENNNSSWNKVSEIETGTPFWLTDDSGRVLVRPRGAAIELPSRATHIHAGRPQSYSRMSFLHQVEAYERRAEARRNGLSDDWMQPTAPLDNHRYRTTEWWIEPGEQLYLLGEATMRDDVVALEFAPGDPVSGIRRRRLLITSGTADQVARRAGWIALVALILTIAGAYAFPPLWAWLQAALDQNPRTGKNPPIDDVSGQSLVAAGTVLAGFFAGYVARLYNRLVSVRERVAAAWSLIDVQLRRRRDLLPDLAAVVEAGARHERDVQTLVAEIRSRPTLPPASDLPDEAAVQRAAASDDADHVAVRQLMALAEAYPALEASEQFGALQQEITQTEDAIAFARSFYNDAVNVQRDRFGAFPGTLFGLFVRAPATELFQAGAPERRAAQLAIEPPVNPREEISV